MGEKRVFLNYGWDNEVFHLSDRGSYAKALCGYSPDRVPTLRREDKTHPAVRCKRCLKIDEARNG
jgi:hypothetical protein